MIMHRTLLVSVKKRFFTAYMHTFKYASQHTLFGSLILSWYIFRNLWLYVWLSLPFKARWKRRNCLIDTLIKWISNIKSDISTRLIATKSTRNVNISLVSVVNKILNVFLWRYIYTYKLDRKQTIHRHCLYLNRLFICIVFIHLFSSTYMLKMCE